MFREGDENIGHKMTQILLIGTDLVIISTRLNEIEQKVRLRDFKVRCTQGLCHLISSLGKKTNEFALFLRKQISKNL
mgnify:CR=1 FL=1